MSEETFAAFKERRRRELQNQIAALKGQLAAKEAELQDIRRSSTEDADRLFVELPTPEATIGDLIGRALILGGPEGVKAQHLRTFIRDAYGRDIQPDSFRSGLARLKNQGRIVQHEDGLWSLTPKFAET